MPLIGTKWTLWVRTRRAVQWEFCLRIGATLVAIFGSQYAARASPKLTTLLQRVAGRSPC